MSMAVASRYAQALVELVLDPKHGLAPEAALSGLSDFNTIVDSSADLKNVLLSPAVPVAKKRAVTGRFADQLGMPPILRNFLNVVIDHRRIGLLKLIRESVQTQLDAKQGIVEAKVASARALADSERDAVTAALSKMTGKQVRGSFSVDPALMGGATARVGSKIYDGSVRGQLDRLRRKLSVE